MSQPYLFLNYRQADTRHAAQRLHADLERHLEPDQIFLDRESIQGGEPRPERLRREAERATAMFTLIGDRWTVPMDDGSGERRLDQEDDWVRLEIAGALARGIDVLPVWVDGHEPNLQLILRRLADLLPLAERQAKTLSSATAAQWEHDVAQLVAWLVDQGFRPRSQVLPPREPDAVEVLAAYRQAVCRDHRCMVPFLEQTSDQLLEKVYVEIHVDVHGAEAEARDGDDRDLPAGRTLHALLAPRATATARRWVVLGEPGAGKSTVARRLALQLAKDDHGPLPVYLSLPGLCQSPRDALALAEEDTATPGAAAALRGAATEGRVWLLLDGLDEVAGTELERARKRVLALADEFPRCPMAVLSRPIGYRDLPAPFRRAALEPLEEAAQQDLLTHWLGATHGTVTWQAIGKRPGLARLARNPLLLTMIAGLSKARPDLPTHRGQLYDRAIDLLLRRGARPQVQADDGTGPPAGVREPGTARRLLAALALALQDHKGATWTETQLGDALRAALAEDPALRRALEENWTNVPNALKDIAHHGAVLGPHKGARRPWEFLHRQFREFLAAEALAAAQGLDLAAEALALARVGLAAGEQELDRHLPAEARVEGLVDHARAAAGDLPVNGERADRL
ncbi:MAG: NACHT domain-containing protein, partial [Planctomycetota bacterium]